MDVKLIPLSSLVAFGIPRPSKWAKDPKVCSLVRSIERDGLLNPLTIKPYKNKFLVVDGKKRLKALLLLARSSRFHKPTYKVSCVLENKTNNLTTSLKRPFLISAPELIHLSLNSLDRGYSPVSIAQRYCCDVKIINSAYADT